MKLTVSAARICSVVELALQRVGESIQSERFDFPALADQDTQCQHGPNTLPLFIGPEISMNWLPSIRKASLRSERRSRHADRVRGNWGIGKATSCQLSNAIVPDCPNMGSSSSKPSDSAPHVWKGCVRSSHRNSQHHTDTCQVPADGGVAKPSRSSRDQQRG